MMTETKSRIHDGPRVLPPFYVATVNYYGSQYLSSLVSSLSDVPHVRKFLLVNHAPDEVLPDLQAPFPIQIISQENRGYGAGLNRAIREIEEDDAIVLFCNPDVMLKTPDAVEQALAYMAENPRIACLLTSLVDHHGERTPSCRTFYTLKTLLATRIPIARKYPPKFLREHYYENVQNGHPMEVDWGCGAAMLYRVSALPDRSPFDERFFLYLEDVDLCTRIWHNGLSVAVYPKLVFLHHGQKRSNKSLRFLLIHMASMAKYLVKYRGFPKRLS